MSPLLYTWSKRDHRLELRAGPSHANRFPPAKSPTKIAEKDLDKRATPSLRPGDTVGDSSDYVSNAADEARRQNMSASPSLNAMSAKRSRDTPAAVKSYLIVYNVLSTLGWGYVLASLVVHLFNLDAKSDTYHFSKKSASVVFSRFLSKIPILSIFVQSFEAHLPAFLVPLYERAQTAYARVGTETAFVQSFAVLEILHVALGWVRSPLPTTAAQVASRLFLVWGVTEQFVETRSHPLYASMVLAWSSVEVIRYSFYAFNLAGSNPHILLWLRYTAFYILYPLGASSEAFLIYASLPSSSPIPGWQSWLQGMWKPTDYIRAGLFVIWWPGLYVMYTYMIAQRRKVLGAQSRKLKSS